jgi:RNA polymerase sigma factor (sigma-70 family)
MTEPPLHAALQHLRRAADADAVSDAELLRRFHHGGDQAAFELLAWRHQRLVFQVCRRVLPCRQDAEDAFQATFLALARRAGAVDAGRPLAGWLHTVAYHAALRVRKQTARRARFERTVAEPPAPARPDPPAPAEQAELERLLDAEIQRLPERYRLPLILCCLKGVSGEQAARQLGCPASTLATRLSRARQRLRLRLARCGLGLALLDVVLTQEAPAAERAALIAGVARAAADLRAGKVLAPAVGRLVTLADAVLRGLRLARWRLPALAALAALALVCAVAAGAFRLLPTAGQPLPPEPVLLSAPQPITIQKDDAPQLAGPRADAHGDPLPAGAVARLGTVRQWNPEGIRALAISADAKLMATASLPSHVRVWNAADGKLLLVMGPKRVKVKDVQEEVALIEQMEFSPDGKWLATLEHIRVVRVWEVATGKELYTVTGPETGVIRSFAFTPKGDQLVLGAYRGDIVVWDLATNKQTAVLKGHHSECLALAFSPDGKYLVSGGFDQKVRRWEWQAAKPEGEVVLKHDNYIIAVAASEGGKRVASSAYDGRVRVWDAVKGEEILQLDPYKQKLGVTVAQKVFLSADGKLLWAGGGLAAGCWKVDTSERVATPAGAIGWMAMTPDRKQLAIGTDRLRLWDLATGKPVVDFAGHDRLPTAAALSPDGSLAVTASQYDRAMHLWDVRTGKVLRTLRGPENGPVWLLFSADGKTLYAAGRTGPGRALGRWDVATGKELEPLDDDDTVSRVQAALSPDGKTLAVLDKSGGLRAYDLVAGKERFRARFPAAEPKELAPCPGLRFLGAGDRLAVASVVNPKEGGHTLKVGAYDVKEGKRLSEWTLLTYKLPYVGIFFEDVMAPTPDGTAVMVADQHGRVLRVTARGGDLVSEAAGTRLPSPRRSERESVLTVAVTFSPDGRVLATTNMGDTVTIRETATGGVRLKLTTDQGLVHAVAFSGDGKRLLTFGSDTTALVWDVSGAKAGKPLAEARLAAVWDDLASADAAVAWQAMQELLSSPAQLLPLAKQHLKPAPVVTEKQLDDWVRALGDTKFAVRQKATVELERAGAVAVPRLRKALADKLPLEEDQRVRKLLETLESGQPPASRLRELRAVELLERLHSPETRTLLEALAEGGAGDVVTLDARAALVRWR